ncbi:MAG TPA: nuclear transport factor 2 family protein [Myxococcota bacterium]|nr:nuclear transport factor 2 family protein [Myxococcota bacterium]
MIDAALLARREATVRTHMEREIAHDWDAVIATFAHPRYELMATGVVHDGESAVREYFRAGRAVVPDQRNEILSLRPAGDDAIVVEFWLLGTQTGGPRPSGKPFKCRMIVLFLFAPGSDKLVCERVYWDSATIARQLAS